MDQIKYSNSILKYPNDILTTECMEVLNFNEHLEATVQYMFDIMVKEKGIGLSANQIGIPLKILVMQDQKGNLKEFVNPEIIEKEGLIRINEGCLSAPGVTVQIPRYKTVTVKAFNLKGEEFTIIAEDLEAVCLQHEIDHLFGVFFLDKAPRNQRKYALKQLGLR